MKYLSIIFFFTFLSEYGVCQDFPDSKGRDFWITFIPNFHIDQNSVPTSPSGKLNNQLFIYIGSDRPTQGTITLRDSNGIDSIVNFQITDPTKLYSFQTFFLPYELRGFNFHNFIDFDNNQSERPVKTSVHVESEDDVTVYALNQGRFTSDAFLVLPTDALGTDYSVMSYTSDFDVAGFEIAASSTPSQFAVVATEDSTVIEIKLTADIFNAGKGENVTATLNRGESYLVQVSPIGNINGDLTGTVISASRPIAVFSGHQRVVLPIENKPILGSRDCLVEQLTPISTWGRTALITQLAVSSNEMNIGSNLFRVLAAYDSTDIYINDLLVASINAQEFYEGRITGPAEVSSSKPTLVAMYKKTSGDGSGLTRIGDPFMMLVPPIEQFLDAYRFINIQAFDYTMSNGNPIISGPIYVEQYLNVVIETDKASTVLLDDVAIDPILFRPIGSTKFSWAQISMTDGVHEVHADGTFGIYTYGYGAANSYGYTGGMAYRPYDSTPPMLFGVGECGSYDGRATDSILGDSRLKYVRPVEGSNNNIAFTLGSFSPRQPAVPFKLSLVNPFLDGSIELEASDNAFWVTKDTINIAGFTVGLKGRLGTIQPERRMLILPMNRNRCETITVENYGLYSHTITSLRTTGGALIANVELPLILAPGDSVEVTICWQIPLEGIVYDTIIIGDSCTERRMLAYEVESRADRAKPNVQTLEDSCGVGIDVEITEIKSFDFGIKSERILDSIQVNCTVQKLSESVQRVNYKVDVIDPFFDAVYGVEVIDSADNVTLFIDTIPGFTLSINGNTGPFTSYTFTPVAVGDARCDTMTITNYGFSSKTLKRPYIKGNILFSFPPGQFDLTIGPKEQYPLVVCYEPDRITDSSDADTIVFTHGCNVKEIELLGSGEASFYSGITRCEVPVDVKVEKSNRFIVLPMPARNSITLALESETTSLVMKLVAASGIELFRRQWTGAPTKAWLIDIEGVPPGVYGIILEHDTGIETGIIAVD